MRGSLSPPFKPLGLRAVPLDPTGTHHGGDMGGEGELLDGLGGKRWVRSVGAELEVRATSLLVRLVLPGGRSRCGADRAVVHRRSEADGGGYAVEWWRVGVGGDEAEVMAEVEVRTPARAAAAVTADLREEG